MPIDASIPLQGNTQQPNLLDTASKAFTLKSAMQQSQQAEQQQKDQALLKQVLSDPAGFDVDQSTGIPIPKPETMQKLYGISPTAAQKLGESTMKLKAEKQQQQERQQKMQKAYIEASGPVVATLATKYEQAAKSGDPQAAWAAIQPEVEAANQQFAQEAKQAGIEFKPITSPQELQLVASKWSKYAEQKLRATQPKTPHEQATEDAPKSTLGKLEADFKAGKIKKADYEAEKKKLTAPTANMSKGENFEGENGKLMAALAERGVALPAGFRSAQQQLGLLNALRSRNQGLSVDEIAEKVKSGQIDLSNERTWGRVAAGIGGKVAYAENEIKQTIPLVREASAKLPRGEFIPYNKLVQMGQEAFSNPDLAEFRMYMTSLSNAYDMLAARGGTDMEKRKENRKNFETAQSAEALERVMQAVVKEAQASGRAAQQSLRVPGREPATGGGGGGGGGGKRWVFDPATGALKPSDGASGATDPSKAVPE